VLRFRCNPNSGLAWRVGKVEAAFPGKAAEAAWLRAVSFASRTPSCRGGSAGESKLFPIGCSTLHTSQENTPLSRLPPPQAPAPRTGSLFRGSCPEGAEGAEGRYLPARVVSPKPGETRPPRAAPTSTARPCQRGVARRRRDGGIPASAKPGGTAPPWRCEATADGR